MDYLERVARHYNEWPKGGVETVALSSEGPWITKDKWLAKRAELQGKPSWDDAPDWAKWLAQDGDNGSWYWYEYKPYPERDEFLSNEQMDLATKFGEVLGSFTDTLEQRPEVQDMKEWKGPEDGLPPIGLVCEYNSDECKPEHEAWEAVRIVAFDGPRVIYTFRDDPIPGYFSSLNCVDFRPLKSAEDKAVDEMADKINDGQHTSSIENAMKIARTLYKEGYRKVES